MPRIIFAQVVGLPLGIGGAAAKPFHLIELNDDGDSVALEAVSEAVLLLGHAAPIGEPVVAHGPFVMNTADEIRQAIRDYQDGKLGSL